jgi:ParB family chromosome partitioning protein
MIVAAVLKLPLAAIDVGKRLRPVDAAYVEMIAASMKDRGQDTRSA